MFQLGDNPTVTHETRNTPTIRRCRRCRQLLPIDQFYTYSYRVLSYCKPCKRDLQHARMSQTIVNQHGVTLTKARIAMCKHRGANWEDIGGFKCEKHPGARWFFFRKGAMWKCSKCHYTDRSHPLNRPKKMERLRNYAERKAGAWGKEAVDMLLEELVNGRKLRLDKLWVKVKCKLFKSLFKSNPSPSRLSRWSMLNKIINGKENAVGWVCQHCGLYSDHVQFFDIDHIKPRRQGGDSQTSNLQILCPNCHRIKTLLDSQHEPQNDQILADAA
jgi:HNH endonuclease